MTLRVSSERHTASLRPWCAGCPANPCVFVLGLPWQIITKWCKTIYCLQLWKLEVWNQDAAPLLNAASSGGFSAWLSRASGGCRSLLLSLQHGHSLWRHTATLLSFCLCLSPGVSPFTRTSVIGLRHTVVGWPHLNSTIFSKAIS